VASGRGFADDGDPFGDAAFDGEQLALTDDDERLPWLETGDYDEQEGSLDMGRLIGFALVLFLLLAAIAAGYWWFSHRSTGSELQPLGTTIAAPDTPYKVRPSDAGGKTFEGTGDTSFAVGEGQSREGKLAAKPATEPTPAPTVQPAVEPSAAPSATPAPAQPVGVNVQVGAYASKAAAEAGWQTLLRRTEHLNGVGHRVVQGQADIGTVFRLQALPGDIAAARQLCASLKTDGVACQVKHQ